LALRDFRLAAGARSCKRPAATALALGATLVSRDTDFGGIDGLTVVVLE